MVLAMALALLGGSAFSVGQYWADTIVHGVSASTALISEN
jgi:hypothetical protein